MAQQHTIQVIAHIRSDFHTKFGIPRQSGLVDALRATVVFEPEYRNPNALRGLEGFSHIWLIWQFSQAVRDGWSPTVRPPRLGGNTRMGVFATRSPFRPNPIGLSCVALEGIQRHPEYGPVLLVRGADLMDGTPIYDVKPYLPYADCHPEAAGGFASHPKEPSLQVEIAPELLAQVPEGRRVFLQMSVEENLEMGAYTQSPSGVPADLEMVFELFPRLKERRRQVAGTLSGGEQQMLAMGRALMSHPKLLMLDEPSMGLAPILVEQIFEIIQNLNKNGSTILLVEQNAQMALSVAHRGYVLETGRVVTTGTGEELIESPEIKKAYLGG